MITTKVQLINTRSNDSILEWRPTILHKVSRFQLMTTAVDSMSTAGYQQMLRVSSLD